MAAKKQEKPGAAPQEPVKSASKLSKKKSKPVVPAPDKTPPSPQRAKLPIAAIGSSAGGLEALQEFFHHMPAESGIGFVVITHLHPGHVSMLPEILAKATKMPVAEATDGTRVKPNHVYVAAPGGVINIAKGVLHRAEADGTESPHLPIDHFFRSLASDQREHAICLVLSGTGTDGTLGMRAIKAESGMAMVQDPPSAKYAGMPASARSTGLADYVLPASGMPEQLVAYVAGPYLGLRRRVVEPPPFPIEPLQRILAMLRARTGHDFTCYKTSTIRRRIARRMNVHHVEEPSDYVRYMQENPHELDMLFSELLISVTSFFRDPKVFEALAEGPVSDLLRSRDTTHALRAWICGCASGEEAYSIAIVLDECIKRLGKRLDVQLFATDLDAQAVDAARSGAYGSGITADVSKERLDRYFIREDNIYRVRKDIREMLVFATQNVLKDPPFTRLDLIVCRNLLIYLDGEAQKGLLPAFHYALQPGGLLLLGPSETIGESQELFDTVDNKAKIFRRRETSVSVYPIPKMPQATGSQDLIALRQSGAPAEESATVVTVRRLLLERFAPTSVVVNEHGTIVYIHGRTGAYLEPAEGQPRNNIIEMARPDLGTALAGAIRRASVDKVEVVRRGVILHTNGQPSSVDLSVSPITEPEGLRRLLLVTIQPSPSPAPDLPPARKGKKEERADAGELTREEELELELQYTKESLQTTIEELETSNEELKSSNEELQSTNEELQSSNEELETSREEMQSLNEELTTVNAELQVRLDELARANDDMQNLLNSTRVATIFLDNDLCVQRYTEQARELFHLIPTDVGRPLTDLAFNLECDSLAEDCRAVLRTLQCSEREVCAKGGPWHLMRIMPYRTAEDVIDGVVLTFMDIDRPKRAEHRAEVARDYFQSIVQTMREPLLVLDVDLRVVLANEGFCAMFQTSLAEVEGQLLYELGGGEWDVRELRNLLEDVLPENNAFCDLRIEHEFGRIGHRAFLLNARRLTGNIGEVGMILLAMEDVTGKKT